MTKYVYLDYLKALKQFSNKKPRNLIIKLCKAFEKTLPGGKKKDVQRYTFFKMFNISHQGK